MHTCVQTIAREQTPKDTCEWKGGVNWKLVRATRRLLFTRHCHHQYCMVYGMQKEGRGGSCVAQ